MKKRPVHLRRSWLFVGAADETAIKASIVSEADACIQEFEDFCIPELREKARKHTPELIDNWKSKGKLASVRINPLEHSDGLKDLEAAVRAGADAILLPKANTDAQVSTLIRYVNELETELGRPKNATEIVPNIEQAEGLMNAMAVLSDKVQVVASLIASEDMTVSLNASRLKNSPILNHVRERFHIICCALNIISIDMRYTWTDDEGVKQQSYLARDIGMISKSTVNPDHCKIINDIFSPSEEQAYEAAEIVKVFERAREKGEGQVNFKGIRLEVPSFLNAKQICQRYDALKHFET